MNEYEQSLNGSWLLAWDQQGQGTRPTTLEGILTVKGQGRR
mgnify:CR=1 FL=1